MTLPLESLIFPWMLAFMRKKILQTTIYRFFSSGENGEGINHEKLQAFFPIAGGEGLSHNSAVSPLNSTQSPAQFSSEVFLVLILQLFITLIEQLMIMILKIVNLLLAMIVLNLLLKLLILNLFCLIIICDNRYELMIN